jgi:hypothetical protein
LRHPSEVSGRPWVSISVPENKSLGTPKCIHDRTIVIELKIAIWIFFSSYLKLCPKHMLLQALN